MTVVDEKHALRKAMRTTLRNVPEKVRVTAGAAVAEHIAAFLPVSAQIVAYFVNTPEEIDTRPLDHLLQRRGLTRALPIMAPHNELMFVSPHKEQHAHNGMASQKPNEHMKRLEHETIDIFFVPGLAFDKLGHRLGRGKGYYDRVLGRFVGRAPRPLFIGIAMDEQIVSHISCEPHDVVMDYLCTPTLGMYQIA